MSYLMNQDRPVGSALTQLDALSDVNISNPQDGDVLTYNGTTGKWVQNSKLYMQKIGEATGSNTVAIPATCKELLLYIRWGGNSKLVFTVNVDMAEHTTSTADTLLSGAYYSASNYHAVTLSINNSTVNLTDWIYNGASSYLATSKLIVYGR